MEHFSRDIALRDFFTLAFGYRHIAVSDVHRASTTWVVTDVADCDMTDVRQDKKLKSSEVPEDR